MSKQTIAEKSLEIRNETQQEGNSRTRVANVIDDINETKLDAPSNVTSGFYYISTSGAGIQYSPINPASYYAIYWNGSSFQPTNIYFHSASGRVGINTGQIALTYQLEVNGSVKISSLIVTSPVNAVGDISFTRQIVQKSDGTIGYIPNVSTPPKRLSVHTSTSAENINDTKADIIRTVMSAPGTQFTITISHTNVYGVYYIVTTSYSNWQPPIIKPPSGNYLLVSLKTGIEIYVSDAETYQLKTNATYMVSNYSGWAFIVEL